MRLDPKLVHPSIFRAASGAMLNSNLASKDAKAFAEVQREWLRQYGMWIAAWTVAFVLGTMAAGMAVADGPKAFRLAVVFGFATVLITALIAGIFATRRRMSVRGLGAMLPLLDLTETQQAYAQTVVALDGAGRSKDEIDETMRTLNTLLDEEARLVGTRERIAGTEDREERAHLLAEREALAAKAAGTRIEGARAAFEQSLTLLDERLSSLDGQGFRLELIDAHLSLLRQAVLSTRDAARRITGGPTETAPDLGTDALRSAVALARGQTQAAEEALAELRAI